MSFDSCYRHPSRPAAIIYLGVPMCDPCFDAECRRQDAEEERAYRERVMAAREKLCSHSPGALPPGVMAAEEEQSGAPVRAREPAPASSANSRARGGRTDPAEPGTAPASSDATADLSHSPDADAPAPMGPATPDDGPGQFPHGWQFPLWF